jgi:hypothetical protein
MLKLYKKKGRNVYKPTIVNVIEPVLMEVALSRMNLMKMRHTV